MHKLAEKMADCLKAKVEGMGIDNIEGAALEELGKWVDIIKDIACYDKDMRIIKAMDEAEENEEKMKYIEEYEEYPEMEMRRGYRGHPRDSMGRYTSRRRGGRRMGYEEPPYYHMTPDMYHDWDDMTDAERMRDMDRTSMNRMYYSGNGSSGQSTGSSGMSGGNMGGSDGNRGGGNSRYENARRGYEETKMTQDNSPEGKKKQMESLEKYLKELGEDMTELVGKMDASEKSMLKSKLQVLAQKVS